MVRLFFFSSRRRHTRCSRDWSSDVCSSDLPRSAAPTRSANESAISQVISTLRTRPCDAPVWVCIPSSLAVANPPRSEEHTSELQSRLHLVCRLLLEKKKDLQYPISTTYCR